MSQNQTGPQPPQGHPEIVDSVVAGIYQAGLKASFEFEEPLFQQ